MANPLTLVMPLEDGVDVGKLSAALAGADAEIKAALTTIGTVHFARFMLFDASAPNFQPSPTGGGGPFRLAVITEYDKDFNSYIQDFVNQIGDVFDVLLSFTADGQSLVPVAENVAAFTAYVAENDASQHGQQGLYSAYPQTVQRIKAAFPPPPAS